MKPLINEMVPIRIISEANMRLEHWAVRKKRHSQHAFFIKMHLNRYRAHGDQTPFKVKTIILTRIAPRNLDYDNLVSSLKFYTDFIADWINPGLKPGQADKNLNFFYNQEKGEPKNYALKIEIY